MADRLRADARSNRDQILSAALAVFRERGTEVPMKEIADRAGVGVGTLYRRFPDRDALITATARAHLERLADMAATSSREESSAWLALTRFLRECAEMRLGAMFSAIEPAAHLAVQSDPRLTETRTSVTDLITQMTRQAQDDGDLRTDLTPEDIGHLMTLQIYTRAAESHSSAINRVLAIVLDGLRPQANSRRL
ncbi:helix-turn-helix domain-containing protein [Nocardia sp. NPDC051030]|uniref:TetR/AcrR family transcriptional regulator n=1 Tax=Nocardia sp. NPDC051030 TaxID=3155162 RepID=UPI00342222C8